MTERRGGIKKQMEFGRLGDDGNRVPTPVELSYNQNDPYAMDITFCPQEPGNIRWTVGRDLFREGTKTTGGEFAGLLDVKIGTSARDTATTIIELDVPDGTAVFEVNKDKLVTFLDKTEKIVPSGEEMKHIDIDETIKKLLTRPYPWE